MRLKSLNNFTHALPLLSPDEAIKLSSEKPHYGTDTRSALANGAINGIAAETICFVITASAIYNKRNVLLLLTGGDSRAIEKSLKGIIKDLCPEKQIKIRREDHLIADGMVAIYKYNKIKE